MTVIAFVGSVFSPWYRAAREGGGGDPLQHCAINVALHGPDGQAWVFTERPRRAAHRQPDALQLGDGTVLQWHGDALHIAFDEPTKPFFARMPPRLRGTVVLTPLHLHGHTVALDEAGQQRWTCVAPRARVAVTLESPALQFNGDAYHDANVGDVPLEHSFAGWHWCRATLPQGTAVVYDTVAADGEIRRLGLLFQPDGAVLPLTPAHAVALGRAPWGVARHIRAEAPAGARVVRTLEASPFYVRSLVALQLAGEPVTAVHESLDLRRFCAPWVQFLLPWRIRRAPALPQRIEVADVA